MPIESYAPSMLLVGPYDPHGGEYTFLAPPLGVWRLEGVLRAGGVHAEVFDPNCCLGPPQRALERALLRRRWDVVGISTTGMTLRFDLELAHLAHRAAPRALLIAGGMEATFRPELMFELGPFEGVVLGEGERPLLELAERLRSVASAATSRGARTPHDVAALRDIAAPGSIPGIAERLADGRVLKPPQRALTQAELREAIFRIPYERMPYQAYWERLERAYGTHALPSKAAREAALAEIRSVRLITLNYCPMACSFCSATNFLHEAQGSVAAVARLEAQDCLTMLERIAAAQPQVRTVIFQDDIFAFTRDRRVLPLCEGIIAGKRSGQLPPTLQFISTNRIDAMSIERLTALRAAGFRVLGFGIENFSLPVLREFNKGHIHGHITPMLRAALDVGITPFLDLILTSPRCRLSDLAATLRQAWYWLQQGCEIGMYPYVVPFSGAAFARDPELAAHTLQTRRRVAGTSVEFDQPSKILPLDATARAAILRIERDFEAALERLQRRTTHLPSRVRSLLWLLAALPTMAGHGYALGDAAAVRARLRAWLPRARPASRRPHSARAAAVSA